TKEFHEVCVALGSTAFVYEKNDSGSEEKLVKWMTFEEAVERSKTEKRKIFIDVYTDWCGWCKVMDKNTFSKEGIAQYLNENYYPVKLNAEQREDIQFKGHTFKYVPEGRRGYHQLAASLLQYKLAYPSVVFLNENFEVIQIVQSYLKPDVFDPMMRFIGEDVGKEKSWAQFQREYQSPYQD
ncbi:MAG: DUF255 domain-containing protein, partial [Bacteroidota bacterium]